MTSRLLPTKLRYLVPTRTTAELCLNAWKGCVSLLSESKSRDLFWDYKKDGIIQKDSLRYSSSLLMGQVFMVSLWDELEQSQRYGFKPYPFLEGVTPALGQFHEIQRKFDQKIFLILHGKTELETEDDLGTLIENDTTIIEQKEDKKDILINLREEDLQQMMRVLEYFPQMLEMNNPDTNWKSKLESIYQWDWNDTIVHDFHRIVSPEFFKSYQLERIVQSLMAGKNTNFLVEKMEVDNTMILSTRVSLLEENTNNNNNDSSDNTNNFKEDELEMALKDNDTLSVAIRVDVLYDMYGTYIMPKDPQNMMILDANDKDAKDNDDEVNDDEYTEVVLGFRCHGVFEGILTGGNDSSLLWRISNVDFIPLMNES